MTFLFLHNYILVGSVSSPTRLWAEEGRKGDSQLIRQVNHSGKKEKKVEITYFSIYLLPFLLLLH